MIQFAMIQFDRLKKLIFLTIIEGAIVAKAGLDEIINQIGF
jgi:hypothetical protein